MNQLIGFLDVTTMELYWEFIKHDSVVFCLKMFSFMVARGLRLIYKYRDDFDVFNKEMKSQITKIFITQVRI